MRQSVPCMRRIIHGFDYEAMSEGLVEPAQVFGRAGGDGQGDDFGRVVTVQLFDLAR